MNHIVKIITAILAGFLALVLPSCSEGTRAPADTETFCIKYNNVEIEPGTDMAAVLASLGEPKSYFEAASCAFSGLDKTFNYGSLRIDTYPDGDTDRILSIVLLDDAIATPEGITIGSSRAEVLTAYGGNYEGGADALTWRKGSSLIKILFRDDSVTSVQYYDANALGEG